MILDLENREMEVCRLDDHERETQLSKVGCLITPIFYKYINKSGNI